MSLIPVVLDGKFLDQSPEQYFRLWPVEHKQYQTRRIEVEGQYRAHRVAVGGCEIRAEPGAADFALPLLVRVDGGDAHTLVQAPEHKIERVAVPKAAGQKCDDDGQF